MSKESDVGYGKPPVKSQFKKGKSGNLSGRRKRPFEPPLDPRKIPIAELKSVIRIIENGKKKKITVAQAIWKAFFRDALNGDKTARKTAVDIMMNLDQYAFEEDGTTFFRITKEERKEIHELLAKKEEYEKILDAYSNQEQGNGSSSSPGPAAGGGSASNAT